MSISAYLYYEDHDRKKHGIDNYNSFSELPEEILNNILINHVYAKKTNSYYDVMGKTDRPESIGESCATLIHNITENDIISYTNLTIDKLNEKVDQAYLDIDKFIKNRMKMIFQK